MKTHALLLIAALVASSSVGAGKPTPPATVSPLTIYDATDTRVAQVVDERLAIVAAVGKHYVTPVSADFVFGARYEILYDNNTCTGQAYFRIDSLQDGNNYLSRTSLYLIDTRPDGIYLTHFGQLSPIYGEPIFSKHEFDGSGQLVCVVGSGMGGFLYYADVVPVGQATGPAIRVGPPGPYSVR